jgi:uncharacterized protein YkwD
MRQLVKIIIISILTIIISALIIFLFVYMFTTPSKDSLVLMNNDEITSYINAKRAKNSAPPLIYDESISRISQDFADKLLQENKNATTISLHHSGNAQLGENLAFFQGFGNDKIQLIKDAIDAWYAEIKDYNFNDPQFSPSTGHFTALVWRSSKKYGVGIAIDEKRNNAAFIVMNFSPPGNIIGQFANNVFPPK